jgi:hypothetical protein
MMNSLAAAISWSIVVGYVVFATRVFDGAFKVNQPDSHAFASASSTITLPACKSM